MSELDNVTAQMNNNLRNISPEDKVININVTKPLLPEDFMAIESIKRIKNPFAMIGVETVMKDLHICKSIAYRLFQREDFPSINIGKSNQIMILAYMIWKMKKQV